MMTSLETGFNREWATDLQTMEVARKLVGGAMGTLEIKVQTCFISH